MLKALLTTEALVIPIQGLSRRPPRSQRESSIRVSRRSFSSPGRSAVVPGTVYCPNLCAWSQSGANEAVTNSKARTRIFGVSESVPRRVMAPPQGEDRPRRSAGVRFRGRIISALPWLLTGWLCLLLVLAPLPFGAVTIGWSTAPLVRVLPGPCFCVAYDRLAGRWEAGGQRRQGLWQQLPSSGSCSRSPCRAPSWDCCPLTLSQLRK